MFFSLYFNFCLKFKQKNGEILKSKFNYYYVTFIWKNNFYIMFLPIQEKGIVYIRRITTICFFLRIHAKNTRKSFCSTHFSIMF